MKSLFTSLFGLLLVASFSAQVPSYVPTDGLVGWWPFNGNANDESGNGNDGVVNGAVLVEDRLGNIDGAYGFQTIGTSINTTCPPVLSNSPRTISFWLNPQSSLTAAQEIVVLQAGGDGSMGAGFSVVLFSSPNDPNSINLGVDLGAGFISYEALISVNSWNHVLISYSSENGLSVADCVFYANGVELTQIAGEFNSSSLVNTMAGSSLVFAIGGDVNQQYSGSMDDVCFYNRALTPAEITQLYTAAEVPVAECNLIASETQDTPVEVGGSAQLYVTLNASDYSMHWQTNAAGLGWMDVQDNNTYNGSQTQNLLVSNATLANHEQPFRIIVTDGICNDTSDVAMLVVNNTCTAYDTITNVVDVFDTTTVVETVVVFDTLTVENVIDVFDTTTVFNSIDVYDTLTVYNTIDIFDTTSVTVEVFDTLTNVIDVFDTTTVYLQVDIFDTLFIDVYDTTYVTITDTTYIQVIDTAYVTVTDTLLIDITFVGFEGQPSWLNTVLVFPNPTSDHITIDYGNFELMAGYNMVITDVTGATVYTSVVNSQQAYIDINAWGAAGVYFMSVYDVNGMVVAVRQIVLE